MIGAKFNVVMRVLLLTGTIYADDLPGECKNVPAKGMAAPSDKEFGGFAEAQFRYGVYCKEKLSFFEINPPLYSVKANNKSMEDYNERFQK